MGFGIWGWVSGCGVHARSLFESLNSRLESNIIKKSMRDLRGANCLDPSETDACSGSVGLGVEGLGLRVTGLRVAGFRVAGFKVSGLRVWGVGSASNL